MLEVMLTLAIFLRVKSLLSTLVVGLWFRPSVWFGLRVLKAVQLMEVPLLKLWIHHVAMDGIINALVDPGKLDIRSRCSVGPHSADKSTSGTPNGITSYSPAVSVVWSHFLIMFGK